MLTNWSTLKERIEYLKDLEQQEADNTFELLTKKEAALRQKRIKKITSTFRWYKNNGNFT
jgi:small subunit ribosomal protein S2